ncbi:integrase [Mesorhizobium sp. M7A.F.Ca.US.001.04.1.1]|uniref:integrase n=1 Tax=unclassified Mesorhizobium TaxID=325217 RepID=UPI000FC99DA7|nr:MULTISPECIES: integrase [unclassified Mesorhizobium]RUY30659.1 integrase [Mesorhizobium sp. M7A.F.Ca.US.001.04.2.1]RUY38446.1 integrase [Mesorhizobium sp. M7A.F.Ca.US.001.04.1.1]RVA04652.1 integrase [Mesorhizobium sp. M7A.F.Ca.US.001.02.1.1]
MAEGTRTEERIGKADDDGAAHGALTYRAAVTAALDWSKRQYEANQATVAGSDGPTVRSAVAAYVVERKKRSTREGGNAEGRLTRHVLSDHKFAGARLSKLRASTIEDWRARLLVGGGAGEPTPAEDDREPITPSTLNRLLNDLRAALNMAAERHRRELPAHLPMEIKVGTRALSVTADARKQLLTDKQIRLAVDAAFEVDVDFGCLALVAASSGARHSQMRLLRVGDVQVEQSRLMMPGSSKGRSAKARPAVSTPVAAEVIERLRPALIDREADAPLLERWAYRSVGPVKWEKDHRRAWGPAYEIDKFWAATIAKAGLPPDTIMYAFRHSSIVRGLKAGLPVRLVAALHDTSSEMIEKHYSAFIVDATEELSRRAALTF